LGLEFHPKILNRRHKQISPSAPIMPVFGPFHYKKSPGILHFFLMRAVTPIT
jgi:hypothetical protein